MAKCELCMKETPRILFKNYVELFIEEIGDYKTYYPDVSEFSYVCWGCILIMRERLSGFEKGEK